MQSQETSSDLLNNFDNHIVRAESGKRLLNYIIDLAFFYMLAIVVGIFIAIASPSSVESLTDDSNPIGDRLLGLVLYGLYMSIIEALFKGKSLGKLITRTRAVNMDGSRITVGTAIARGFSRAVPFCAFSALGSPCNPWQDKWTDTLVIDERLSEINAMPKY
jgi:uncharacterized RDD family membrane protein YckC